MLGVFLFFSLILFFGLIFILSAFGEESLELRIALFIFGGFLVLIAIISFNYEANKINKKERILLTYIIDNNLTNKKIEKKFKNEIFEIKKEKAINKLKKEIEGK